MNIGEALAQATIAAEIAGQERAQNNVFRPMDAENLA